MTAASDDGQTAGAHSQRVLVFGTADITKPRVRLLLDGLEQCGHTVIPLTINIWRGVEDKSQVRGVSRFFWLGFKWLAAMLWLSLRYPFSPRHDAVLVCYPGYLDLWWLRLVSWTRRKPVLFDAFLSVYDTVVLDRAIARPSSLIGRLCFFVDKAALHLADKTFLDTPAHARFFERCFRVTEGTVGAVPVGTEKPFVAPHKSREATPPFRILFYGQFIPLHGIPVIIDAFRRLGHLPIRLTLVGRGQTEADIDANLAAQPIDAIERLTWVDYQSLPTLIQSHDLGLGVFSASDKAGRVIPNKIYQMLACGLPVLTREGDGIEAITKEAQGAIRLCPPASPESLAQAIEACYQDWLAGALPAPPADTRITAKDVGEAISRLLP